MTEAPKGALISTWGPSAINLLAAFIKLLGDRPEWFA